MIKALGIGDNVCDIYIHTNLMYPGGQAFNFAANAKILGAESAFIGVHGDDAAGRYIIETMKKRKIDYSHTRIYQREENGFACVTLVDGDRVFIGSNKGGVLKRRPIQLTEDDLEYIAEFDIVHMSNNGFTDSELPKLKHRGPLVSYDFSYRWNEEERIDRVCPNVNFAFASCSELNDEKIWDLLYKMHIKGCGVAIGTRGSDGAFVFDGKKQYRQLPKLVKPVDTMGAGDGFATAVMVAVAESLCGLEKTIWEQADFRASVLPEALKTAATFSAQCCLIHGGSGDGIKIPEEMWPRIKEVIAI